MKEINVTNQDIPCSGSERINIIKMCIPHKAIYRFNTISIKIPMAFSTELTISDFKEYHKAIVIKTALVGWKTSLCLPNKHK